MASTILLRVFILAAVLGLAGCVKLPNFPMFYSHQDLLDKEREIDDSFKRRID